MNRFSRQQDLELGLLAQAPAHPILIQMLSMAQKNGGKKISVSWKSETGPETCILEAIFSDDTREFVGRKAAADSREPRWTLSIETDDKRNGEEKRKPEDRRTQLWSHVSGDVGLIQNLIWSETTGTNHETAESMFLTTHTAKLGHKADRSGDAQYSTSSTPAVMVQPAPAAPPSSQATASVPQNVTLVGELAEIDLSGIFQSIMICKMTGRLDIQDRMNQAEIFFDDGACVHAQVQSALSDVTKTITGDQALLSLLTWDAGRFLFQKDRKCSERTVKRRLEGLLLEGASLRDYHKYLRTLGVSEESVLHKRNPDLTDDEINAKLADGVPIDSAIQKKLYHEIDGKKSLFAVIDVLNISKTLWTPIVFNLFSCELIASEQGAVVAVSAEDAPPIDQSMVAQAGRSLVRPETGLYTFPLFIHFMEQEIARMSRAQTGFSVIIFDLKNGKESLSNSALQQVAERFDAIKEKFDILGHYKVFEFIMLLPLRSDEECRDFAAKFLNAVKQSPLDGVATPDDIKGVFGISSAPSDKDALAALLLAAEQAKNACVTKSALCLTARDVRWEKHTQHASKASYLKSFVEAETALVAACNEAEHFRPGDPRLMQTVEELANLQLRQDRFAMAETLLELLLSLKEQAHGEQSAQSAACSAELARCYYLQGKYTKAEPVLQTVVSTYEVVYGHQHIASANALYNLGTLYQVQNRLNEVMPIFKKVLALKTALLGEHHNETIKIRQQYESLISSDGANQFTTGTFRTYQATEGELQ